jgi:hypothetical protein
VQEANTLRDLQRGGAFFSRDVAKTHQGVAETLHAREVVLSNMRVAPEP